MKKRKGVLTALLLSAAMAVTALPAGSVALAADNTTQESTENPGTAELTDGEYTVSLDSSLGMFHLSPDPVTAVVKGDNATLTIVSCTDHSRYDQMFIGKYSELDESKAIVGVPTDGEAGADGTKYTFTVTVPKSSLVEGNQIYYVLRYRKGYELNGVKHDGDWYKAKSGKDYYFTVNSIKSVEKAKSITITSDPAVPEGTGTQSVPMTIQVGDTITLKANVEPATAVDKDKLTWNVPKVRGKVALSQQASGDTVRLKAEMNTPYAVHVTASIPQVGGNIVHGDIYIKVVALPGDDIKLDTSALTLEAGKTASLKATTGTDVKSVTWSSDNENIATVDDQGNITTKTAGTATITATTDAGKSASCTVTVTDPAQNESVLNVNRLIDALPDKVTEKDRTAVVEAEKAFIALDDDKEQYVTNKKKLDEALASLPAVTPSREGDYTFTQTILNDQTHNYSTVEVIKTSSTDSMMFRPVATTLRYENGKMLADVTLSGHGNVAVYLGSGKEAKAAEDAAGSYEKMNGVILPQDKNAEQFTFTIPLTSLEKPVQLAVRGRSKWYDRAVIFHTSNMTLPQGLQNINGQLVFMLDGKIDTTYTGFAKAENSTWYWYVEKGKVNTSKNEVVQDKNGAVDSSKGWWNVVNGRLAPAVTVAKNNNGWWYIDQNGKVDFGFNGIADNTHGTWYLTGGKVRFNVTDVVKTSYNGVQGWYNIIKGELVKKKDVAKNSNGWWYIDENGKVDFTKNSVEKNSNGWWKITNGKVNFGFTGVADNENGAWYLTGGKVRFNVTDVVKTSHNGVQGWYNIHGGKLTAGPTVAHNSNGWWYIGTDGKVNFGFTGIADNQYGAWYLNGGKVNFGKNDVVKTTYNGVNGWYNVRGGKLQKKVDVAKNSNGWWYIDQNGKVDFTKNGVEKNSNGWWKITNGKVDFGYNGLASNSNGTWYIKNGKVDFSANGYYQGKRIRGGKVVG